MREGMPAVQLALLCGCLALALVSTASTAGAQATAPEATPPDATLRLEGPGTSPRVGERFTVTGLLSGAPDAQIVSVQIDTGSWARVLEVRELAGADAPERPLEIDAVLFRAGQFVLERATATLLGIDGTQTVLTAPAFQVNVPSSIANESAPEPVPSAPPFPVLTRDIRPLIALGVLGAGLFAVLGYQLARMRGAGPIDDTPVGPPPRPAWELALEALDLLEREGLLEDGGSLSFHMRLSEILRAYLGARFGFAALEATTSEIALALAVRPDEVGEWRHEILRVLRDMDLVKFAKHTAAREESEALLSATRQLVLDLSARDRAVARESEGEGEGAAT
jgi:hypothetical protein